MVVRNELVNRMRLKILDDPTRPIRRIFNEVTATDRSGDDDDEYMDSIPDFAQVRSSLSRSKSKCFPSIPRRVRDIVVRGKWRKTWNSKDFLVHQDNTFGLMIFMSQKCAVALQKCSDIYVDGTFATCPKPFKQLVTIHGKYGNRILPLAFCLLTSKRTALYREMIRQLQQSILRLSGQAFQPDRVICDFEISLMTAIETDLPNAVIKGCYFHFCQSLWRKVQELGLSVLYRQNSSVKKVVRKIMSLAFLPLAIVRMTFNLIYTSRSIARLFRNHPSLREFVNYFSQTYMNGLFRPSTWNVYDRDVDCRTNNHVEGNNVIIT